jgi:ABC-type amino acid transport substrate-binding protein
LIAKFTSLLLISFLSLSLPAHAAEKTLVLAVETGAPWSYIKDGKIVGLDVDIAQAASKEMGYQLVIKQLPVRRALYTLASGEADLIFYAYGPEPAEKKSVAGVKVDPKEIYTVKTSAFSLKSKKLKINTFEEMYSYRIGHRIEPNDLEDAVLPGLNKRLRVSNTDQLVKVLLSERIDIAISEDATFNFSLKHLNVGNQIEPVFNLPPVKVFIAWSEKNIVNNTEHVKKFSDAIQRLKNRGELIKIFERNNVSDSIY